jgi:hypothetical protein
MMGFEPKRAEEGTRHLCCIQRRSRTAVKCTDTGKLIEHIYGFLMIVERILAKYDEKNSDNQSE